MFTAYDVHQTESISDTKTYPFGIGPERCAIELRKFADDVAAGRVMLQRVTVKSIVEKDDFPMSHLEIEFFEPRNKT